MNRNCSGTAECAICLEALAMPGIPLFVAECGHSFHFRCIQSNAQAGNQTCPLCRVNWQTLPFTAPQVHQVPVRQTRPTLQHRTSDESYADDQPLDVVTPEAQRDIAPTVAGQMTVAMQCERVTVDGSSAQPVTVLVSVKAPCEQVSASGEAAPRAGVDIIAVLDVSGSMSGPKITQLRQTLLAAIELLGPADRLSLIKFESFANRLTPLTRMTEAGRRAACDATVRLAAAGGTDIAAALSCAAAVVEGRRARNPVCGVILLTDGQDSGAHCAYPPLVARLRAAGATVSAFGYGGDHDARLLEGIAEAGRGTFTYVERVDGVRETFGRCLGSLFSVAAQAVRLDLRPLAGAAIARVSADGAQAPLPGGGVRLDLGELFSDESRDLLVELTLPAAAAAAAADGGPMYLEAEITWVPPGGDEAARRGGAAPSGLRVRRAAAAELAAAEAAEAADPAAAEARAAVDRHRSRLEAVQALARAAEAGDAGRLDEARQALEAAARRVQASPGGREGYGRALVADLQDALQQLNSAEEYRTGGSAKVRSKRMAHGKQRTFESASPQAALYATPMQSRVASQMSPGPYVAGTAPPPPPPPPAQRPASASSGPPGPAAAAATAGGASTLSRVMGVLGWSRAPPPPAPPAAAPLPPQAQQPLQPSPQAAGGSSRRLKERA